MMEEQAVYIETFDDKLTLFGLAPLYHTKSVYIASATYDAFLLKVIKQLLDVSEIDINYFKS